MCEFRLSKDADDDVKEISRYTTLEFGDKQAIKYKNGLFETLKNLAKRPNLGRDVSFLIAGARRFNFKSHSIFYRVTDSGIFIFRILGNSRIMKGIFKFRRISSSYKKKRSFASNKTLF